MAVRFRAFHLISLCNFTTLKDKQLRDIQGPLVTRALPIFFILIFIVGLPSNMAALFVLLFRTPRLPSTSLLINLTLCDVLLLLVLPFRVLYHFHGNHWSLGEPFCRVVIATFYGNTYGSSVCLAFVAIDRYVALVHPFGAKTLRSKKTSLYMTVAVWGGVCVAMAPLLATRQTYFLDELRITTCHDALPRDAQQTFFLPYFCTLFTLGFLLPAVVMLFCHCAVLRALLGDRARYAHAARVTALVIFVFVACLLPSNVLLLLTYADTDTEGKGQDLYVAYMVSLAVSALNSCIDPFIYYYVSEEFRGKVKEVLCCRGDEKDNNKQRSATYSSSSSSASNSNSAASARSKVTLLTKTTSQGAESEQA